MKKTLFITWLLVAALLIGSPVFGGERVVTVGGNQATRPISDFGINVVDVYYVDSVNGDDGRAGKSPETAFATLDYAIGRCTANQGDIIYLMPNSDETVASAGAIAADVAGISIIGLGDGADRPTFTFSATDATMTISAASVTLKNVIIVPSVDSVVSPIVISGANCSVDVEFRDASAAVEMVHGILTTAAADNLKLDVVYKGFADGNACISPVRLVGCDNGTIDINYYGEASAAVVEFHTTACSNIQVSGYFYNDNTALSKNVVDTVTGSTWYATGYDGKGGYSFSGGSAAALAADDTGSVASNVTAILADTAAADTSSELQTLVTGSATGGADILADTSAMDTPAEIAVLWAHPRCLAKTDGAVLNGDDDLFIISGGPVRAKITGIVTTPIGGAANGKLTETTTTPSATVDLNAGAVAIDNDAAGTSYRNVGATSVFTPVTAGVVLIDPVTVEDTEFLLPIGTVKFNSSAAQDGVIAWYITYWPLSPDSVVTAAP